MSEGAGPKRVASCSTVEHGVFLQAEEIEVSKKQLVKIQTVIKVTRNSLKAGHSHKYHMNDWAI